LRLARGDQAADAETGTEEGAGEQEERRRAATRHLLGV